MLETSALCVLTDVQGGCIAMALREDKLVVVSPGKLEVHSLIEHNTLRYRRIHAMELDGPLGHTQVVFDHQSTDDQYTVIRLCYSVLQGLFIYDMLCPVNGDDIVVLRVWHYKQDYYEEEFPFETLRPSFGTDTLYISWFNGPRRLGKHVRFLTSPIPMPKGAPSAISPPAGTEPYVLADPDMPALYCMGVRAYDERRGVLALGNACGELMLYDFSGTDSRRLEACFEELVIPSIDHQESLSQVRTMSLWKVHQGNPCRSESHYTPSGTTVPVQSSIDT